MEPGQVAYEARFSANDVERKFAPAWSSLSLEEKIIWLRVELACVNAPHRRFKLGQLVQKRSGPAWRGTVVGFYTSRQTRIGYCVESAYEPGSVQIYPEAALEPWTEI